MVLGTYCKSPCAGVPNLLLISPMLPCVTPALPPDSAWINEIIFFKSLPFRVTPILLAAFLISGAHLEAALFLRSEERRVGKESRCMWLKYDLRVHRTVSTY